MFNIINSNVNVNFENVYLKSQKYLRDTISSVESKTLKQLYTDEFIPNRTKMYETTVVSLKTGLPKQVFFKILCQAKLDDCEYFLCVLEDINKKILGIKKFGIAYNPNNRNEFLPGYIKSKKNNAVAGTQIRLLQAACEIASRLGINSIPLESYYEAANFHTMMGFRPKESFTEYLNNPNNAQKRLKYWLNWLPRKYKNTEVVPIISKENNSYFLDLNRTKYCVAVQKNKEYLEINKKRRIKPSPFQFDCIDMILEGAEFEKWKKRIKGFEITNENDKLDDMPFCDKIIF